MNKLPAIPQLSYGQNQHGKNCWQLTHSEGALTVSLEVRYHPSDPGGPNHYRTVVVDEDSEYMGSWRELMSHEDANAAYAQIAEHEGQETAERWLVALNNDFLVLSEHHLVHQISNGLKQRWEAMLTLGLFTPHVTE